MNIQIFGARKSFDTKKAERWFKERRIKYQYIDLDSKGLSPGEYRSIRAAVGYDALVDRDSPDYRELGIDYLLPLAAEEKLLENPWLFHRPQRPPGHRGLLPRRVENLGIRALYHKNLLGDSPGGKMRKKTGPLQRTCFFME